MKPCYYWFPIVYVLITNPDGQVVKNEFDGMDQGTVETMLQNKKYTVVNSDAFNSFPEPILAKPALDTSLRDEIMQLKTKVNDLQTQLTALEEVKK